MGNGQGILLGILICLLLLSGCTSQNRYFWMGADSNISDSNFIDLHDTPASYTGKAGEYCRVNTDENGLEFAEVQGGDLNDTNVFNSGVPDCSAGQYIYGFNSNGTMDCRADQSNTDTNYQTGGLLDDNNAWRIDVNGGGNDLINFTDGSFDGSVATGKLTVNSGVGQSIIIKGTSTGNNNVGWIGFYDSDGTTRRGYIGDSSSGNDDIVIRADTGDLSLRAAGTVNTDKNFSIGSNLLGGVTFYVAYINIMDTAPDTIMLTIPWTSDVIPGVATDGQPDVPRNISVSTFPGLGAMEGTITILGTNADGTVIKEVITINTPIPLVYVGDSAFARISLITVVKTDGGMGAFYSIGTDNNIGLVNSPLNDATDVIKVNYNGRDIVPEAGYTVDPLHGTIQQKLGDVLETPNLEVWYRPFN